MKIKEIGESVMNFDLGKLEQPITLVIYTYLSVLLVTFIAVIALMIWFFTHKDK